STARGCATWRTSPATASRRTCGCAATAIAPRCPGTSRCRRSTEGEGPEMTQSHTGRPALPPSPSFRLDGRRALVTGAGRGIGLAAAAALADAGAAVTLVARTAAQIEAAAEAIRARGGQA